MFAAAITGFTSCNTGNTVTKEITNIADTLKKNTIAPASVSKQDSFPVISLPTIDGVSESDSPVTDFDYPKNVALPEADSFKGQISVFGAAYEVWVGPKGWTGMGDKGADGNTVAHLHPVNGNDSIGPHITYYEIPACQGCIIWSAAPYFPNARKNYKEAFDQELSSEFDPPAGIKITRLSSTLVTWSLPDTNGLLKRGVAYYIDEGDPFYTDAVFVLPADQARLADFLTINFIRFKGLK